MNSTPLPAQAQVIVIGGGIAGCSTAYHLAKQGVGDVVVMANDRIAHMAAMTAVLDRTSVRRDRGQGRERGYGLDKEQPPAWWQR